MLSFFVDQFSIFVMDLFNFVDRGRLLEAIDAFCTNIAPSTAAPLLVDLKFKFLA